MTSASGDEITFYTYPDEDHYNNGYYTLIDSHELVFQVRSSTDAKLAITSVAGVTSSLAVEIVIGAENNERSVQTCLFPS